jgi:hypothetical protein
LHLREELAEIVERYEALPPEDDAEQVRAIVQVLPHRSRPRR